LKLLSLLPKSSSKVSRGERELSEKDVEEIPKGLTPGEWIIVQDQSAKKQYVGYCNPYSENFFKIKLVHHDSKFTVNVKQIESDVAWELLLEKIKSAIELRKSFKDYNDGCRLIYGLNDSLPGLIVDKYSEVILIQINTAGVDRFREKIKECFTLTFSSHKVVFFDNPSYRKAEVLPIHEEELGAENLKVLENGIHYSIPAQVVQKIGYYYDHRENRNKLKNLLIRLDKSFNSGLDLFSYVGSWGLHLLQAGVKEVEFVDQADMEKVTNDNLKLNGFEGRGKFTRQDVFKYLDASITAGSKFDVVVSDPPAFTKSEKNKINAIQGYEKLHTKAMKLVNENGLLVVASCTHYVSFEELDKTVQEAAFKNTQRVQLLDLGVQGFDHPFNGFKDKSFYIKYMVYTVHRG